MYAATIDDTRYTFQASGSLWRDALVMQDLQTRSLWSQPLGECIRGKMEGAQLEEFPAQHMTYAEFKARFPEGVVLQKPDIPKGSPYDGYFADRNRLGVFGRANNFERLDGKDVVVGLRSGGQQMAVSKKYLQDHGYALISGFADPVVVAFDAKGDGFSAFSVPAESEITVQNNQIRAGSKIWQLHTGRAVSDNTVNLESFPMMTAYWFAWVSFFPNTDLTKLAKTE